MRKRERFGAGIGSSTRAMAGREDVPRVQSLELRQQALGITKGAMVSQVGESSFLLSQTLSFDVKVSPPSTRKARVDGYEKACLLTFYRTKVGGVRDVTCRP